MGRKFEERGYQRLSFEKGADYYIINTCSVTDHADRKCKKVVKDAKKANPEAKVFIIGCYAQLKPEEIAGIPGVDAVLGAAEKFQLVDFVDTYQEQKQAQVLVKDIAATNEFCSSYSLNERTRTFLKVQDGCNYNCSFCTIPLARGKSRSDSIANIVAQAKEIAEEGTSKEVVLTGVNIGDFGIQGGRRKERFLDLIKALDEVEGIERFRISSIEPNLLSDDIIAFVADSQRFMPHFHIPLQSGSDALLEKMRRRYRTDLYRHRVEKIIELMPDACIGVDVITGFPGETEDLFLESLQFIRSLEVGYLHVFTYSERDNTAAIELDGRIPERTRKERTQTLRLLSEQKKNFFYQRFLGETRPVLFEEEEKAGMMSGFTDNYIKVEIPYDEGLANKIVAIKLGSFSSSGALSALEIVEAETV